MNLWTFIFHFSQMFHQTQTQINSIDHVGISVTQYECKNVFQSLSWVFYFMQCVMCGRKCEHKWSETNIQNVIETMFLKRCSKTSLKNLFPAVKQLATKPSRKIILYLGLYSSTQIFLNINHSLFQWAYDLFESYFIGRFPFTISGLFMIPFLRFIVWN